MAHYHNGSETRTWLVQVDQVRFSKYRRSNKVLQGEQEAILDRDLFEAVQAKLDEQANNHKRTRTRSEALLTGRIFDDGGNRMSPTHARKAGVKYRYYLSSALLNGAHSGDRDHLFRRIAIRHTD